MTIEEKARAYDEAFERAKDYYKANQKIGESDENEVLSDIFPELAESEDEKIKNAIITTIHLYYGELLEDEAKEMITWLERQGEQKHHEYTLEQAASIFLDALSNTPYNNKPITDAQFITKELLKFLEDASSYNPNAINEQAPADKVKSKFKVGDFIMNDYCFGKVIEITNDAYLLDTGQGIPFSCEHNAHLWTIEDAKPGDVLAAHECYVIFKEIDGLNIKCYCTYHYMNNPSFHVDTLQNKDAFHPATKEQRDALFTKMREAGYEWNDEKKELRKA